MENLKRELVAACEAHNVVLAKSIAKEIKNKNKEIKRNVKR